MLHILFLILKIAGVLLLAILGLILLIILTVLLVPVRYRGQGSFYGKPEGIIKVSWLLRLFSVRLRYYGEPEVEIRILGFRAFREKAENKEEFADDVLFPDNAADGYQDEPILSVQELKDPKTQFSQPEEIIQPKAKNHPGEQHPQEGGPPEKDCSRIKKKKENIGIRIGRKITDTFQRLMHMARTLFEKLKKAEKRREMVLAFFRDEENIKTYALIKKQIKKILRHVLPVRLKGNITFGFEEPYTTGQILAGAALLYPIYRDNIIIQPVFDRQVLEGEVRFKGRIRIGTLLKAGVRILLNKNFRKQLKKFLNRGGIENGR